MKTIYRDKCPYCQDYHDLESSELYCKSAYTFGRANGKGEIGRRILKACKQLALESILITSLAGMIKQITHEDI